MKVAVNILILIAIVLFFNNCGNKKGQIINENKKIYEVDEFSDDFFQWDGFVDRIEFIQLETTSNSVIGQVTKGVIENDDIYLFDFRNQILLNFGNNGKFIRKIGQRGKGPKEYLEIRDFCISDSNLYTLDYKKIFCYNRNTGDLIDSWSFKSEKGFNPENFVIYNKNKYFLWNSNPDVWNRSKGDYYRMRKIENGKIESEYFKYEYDTSNDPRFYACGNGSYYLKPVDGEYTIFKLTRDSLFTSFEIDFGARAILPKEISNLRNSKVRNAYLKSNFFKSISNILETKDYLYFKCIGPESKIYEGLICKKTGETKFGRWDYKKSPRFFFTDGDFLYGYYEPYTLINRRTNPDDLNKCFDFVRNNIKDVKISDNLIMIKAYLK